MRRNIIMAFLVSILCIPFLVSAATFQIDPAHSSFGFKVRHLTVSNVKGTFDKVVSGSVHFDDVNLSHTKAEVVIDAASINTAHAKRDEHLRSPDFFDVAKHPTITFVTKQVTRNGPDRLKVTGNLSMLGVTREIVLDVLGPSSEIKDPGGNVRRGFSATGKINRKDWGIRFHKVLETGGLVVGDEVEISVEGELIRK
jgi:polyisoprenoid-binding protein YceI